MRPISGKKLCKTLERHGWTHTRTESSHRMFNHPDSRLTLAIPVHGNQDVPIGTLKALMRDAGLKDRDL